MDTIETQKEELLKMAAEKEARKKELEFYSVKLDEIKAVVDEAESKKEDIAALDVIIKQKKESIEALNTQIASLKQEIISISDTISLLKAQASELAQVTDSLTNAKADYAALIVKHDAEVTAKTAQKDALSTAISANQTIISQLDVDIARKQNTSTDLQDKVKTLSIMAESLQERVNDRSKEVCEILDSITKNNQELSSILSAISVKGDEIKRLDIFIEKKKQDQDEELVIRASDVQAREDAAYAHENANKIKEQYLDDKEMTLKEFKANLERATGKVIPVIM